MQCWATLGTVEYHLYGLNVYKKFTIHVTLYAAVASSAWKSMRDSYVRARSNMRKKLPSGSGRPRNTNRFYKYAGEMSFLEVILNLEEVEDSMTTTSNTEQESDKVSLIFSVATE